MSHGVGELGAETERVDGVREGVFLAGGEVLVQVVHVHLRSRERLAGRDVKVADHLVDG